MNKLNKKTVFTLIIDVILILTSFYAFRTIIEKPGLPLKIDRNNSVNDSLNEKTINKGDTLLSLNGKTVKMREQVEFFCDNSKVGQMVIARFKSNTGIKTVSLTLINYYRPFYLTVLFIVYLVFILPGFYVLLKKPNDKIAIIFHWAALSSGFFIAFTWGKISQPPNLSDYLVRYIFDASELLLGALILHFSIIFPVARWKNYKRIMFLTYLYTMIVLGILFVFNTKALMSGSIDIFADYFYYHDNLLEYSFTSLIFFGLLNLITSHFLNKDEVEQRKLKWVLFGIIFATLVYIVLWQLPKRLLGDTLIPEWLMISLTAVAPVTFSISIVKYRILDIDFLINRSIVYSTGLVMIILSYMFSSNLLQNLFKINELPETKYYITYISTIIAAIIFELFKNNFQIFIDKNFFKIRYNFRSSQKLFLENIKFCMTNNQVGDLIVDSALSIMAVDKIACLTFNHITKEVSILRNSNYEQIENSDEFYTFIVNSVEKNQTYGREGILEEGIVYDKIDDFSNENISADLILTSYIEDYRISAILLLGKKKSRFRYTLEDFEILKIKLNSASSAIHRITLQNELLIQQEETKRLAELNHLKSNFVSSVSHELKTPLTSIKIFAEIMLMKETSRNKSVEYLEIIQSECNRLNRLINNVLNFSKIEKGMKQYNFIKVNLNEIVEKVILLFKSQSHYQEFVINKELDYGLSEIFLDSDAVSEAIINLVSNAVKYSEKGSIITIKTGETGNHEFVSVQDNGFGISDEDLKQIFEPFFRSGDEKKLHSGGTGLGLSIVKNIIDSHKGTVDVKSQVGMGSTFTLIFQKEFLNEKNINN